MAKKLYVADRDFDHFTKGVVVELDEDNPYVRTGYLEEWSPEATPEPGAPAIETPPELSETTVEPVTDGPAPPDDEDDEDEGEEDDAEPASTGRAGSRARARGRR